MAVGVITASIAERQSLKERYTAESVFRLNGSKDNVCLSNGWLLKNLQDVQKQKGV